MHQELSPKEWEVAAEVAQGKTNKEISLSTGLSPFTVKEYVANARRKTGSVNRAAPGRVVRQTPVHAAALIPPIRNARKAGL